MMYNHDCRYIIVFTIVHFDCLFDGTSVETNCSMLEVSCFIWNVATPNLMSYFCSSAASTPLTVKEIQNELNEMTAEKWYQLGVQLGISPATLSTIESDYPRDAQRCMTEVIIRWLRNAPEFPWAKLAEAVEVMGGYAALAEKLRQKISQG